MDTQKSGSRFRAGTPSAEEEDGLPDVILSDDEGVVESHRPIEWFPSSTSSLTVARQADVLWEQELLEVRNEQVPAGRVFIHHGGEGGVRLLEAGIDLRNDPGAARGREPRS
jgi:hypothetical protein